MWDGMKTNILVAGAQVGLENAKGIGSKVKEMIENLNLEKDATINVQKGQRSSDGFNPPKSTPRYNIIKLAYIKDKEDSQSFKKKADVI